MKKTYPKTSYKKNYSTRQTVIYKTPKPKLDVKYTDNSLSNGAVSSSGTFTSVLSNMVRGVNGLNAFVGNNIQPVYLQVDYYWNTNQTFNSCRLMIFQWFDATTPVLSGILQNTSTGIGTISGTFITNKPYMKVLYDDKFIIAPTAGGDTTSIGNGVHYGCAFVPAKKLKPVRFNSITNAVQDGNIYVLVLSDDIAPTYPAVTFNSRLAFTDS